MPHQLMPTLRRMHLLGLRGDTNLNVQRSLSQTFNFKQARLMANRLYGESCYKGTNGGTENLNCVRISVGFICIAGKMWPQVPVFSPSEISFSAPAGSTTPVSQNLNVTGAPGQSWRLQTVGSSWLKFITGATCSTPTTDCTITSPGSTLSITMLADPTGLAPYTYTTNFSVGFPGGITTTRRECTITHRSAA